MLLSFSIRLALKINGTNEKLAPCKEGKLTTTSAFSKLSVRMFSVTEIAFDSHE